MEKFSNIIFENITVYRSLVSIRSIRCWSRASWIYRRRPTWRQRRWSRPPCPRCTRRVACYHPAPRASRRPSPDRRPDAPIGSWCRGSPGRVQRSRICTEEVSTHTKKKVLVCIYMYIVDCTKCCLSYYTVYRVFWERALKEICQNFDPKKGLPVEFLLLNWKEVRVWGYCPDFKNA